MYKVYSYEHDTRTIFHILKCNDVECVLLIYALEYILIIYFKKNYEKLKN